MDLLILGALTLEEYGIAGAVIVALLGLLFKFRKDNKEKDKTFVDEINKRDTIIVNMQEKTVEALTESNIVIKENTEKLKDLSNDKT